MSRHSKNQTLPGTAIINAAGTSQTPKDRVSLQTDYVNGPLTLTFVERYYGSFHLSGNPTLIATNSIAPYWQTDINLATISTCSAFPARRSSM